MGRKIFPAALALVLTLGLVGCQGAKTTGREVKEKLAATQMSQSLASPSRSALERNGVHDAAATKKSGVRIVQMRHMRSDTELTQRLKVKVSGAATGLLKDTQEFGGTVTRDARDAARDVKNGWKDAGHEIAQGAEKLARDAKHGLEETVVTARDDAEHLMQ